MGYGVQYIQRVNMSTGIVCMLNNTALKDQISMAEAASENALNFSKADNSSSLEDLSKCYFQVAEGHKIDAVKDIYTSQFSVDKFFF